VGGGILIEGQAGWLAMEIAMQGAFWKAQLNPAPDPANNLLDNWVMRQLYVLCAHAMLYKYSGR